MWAWTLATDDKTDQEIADAMHISRSTLSEWKKKYKDFGDALKSGKAPTDAKVKHALYDRCVGYSYTERRSIVELDSRTGEQKPIRIESIEKHVPPDPVAILQWLNNRDPANWRTKQDPVRNVDAHNGKMQSIADLINYPAKNRDMPG